MPVILALLTALGLMDKDSPLGFLCLDDDDEDDL